MRLIVNSILFLSVMGDSYRVTHFNALTLTSLINILCHAFSLSEPECQIREKSLVISNTLDRDADIRSKT